MATFSVVVAAEAVAVQSSAASRKRMGSARSIAAPKVAGPPDRISAGGPSTTARRGVVVARPDPAGPPMDVHVTELGLQPAFRVSPIHLPER